MAVVAERKLPSYPGITLYLHADDAIVPPSVHAAFAPVTLGEPLPPPYDDHHAIIVPARAAVHVWRVLLAAPGAPPVLPADAHADRVARALDDLFLQRPAWRAAFPPALAAPAPLGEGLRPYASPASASPVAMLAAVGGPRRLTLYARALVEWPARDVLALAYQLAADGTGPTPVKPRRVWRAQCESLTARALMRRAPRVRTLRLADDDADSAGLVAFADLARVGVRLGLLSVDEAMAVEAREPECASAGARRVLCWPHAHEEEQFAVLCGPMGPAELRASDRGDPPLVVDALRDALRSYVDAGEEEEADATLDLAAELVFALMGIVPLPPAPAQSDAPSDRVVLNAWLAAAAFVDARGPDAPAPPRPPDSH